VSMKGIKINDRDPNTGVDIPYIVGKITDSDGKEVVTDNDISNVYEVINKRKQYFWEAQSYFEPVWDELVGLQLIRIGAVLYAVKEGAGLKIVRIPPGTDPATLADMKTAAKTLDSYNGWFIVPIDEADIQIGTGGHMVDYDALKQALLGSLAAKTGYPKAGFEGIEMERQGGSFNEERLLDCERILQRAFKGLAKWLTLKWSDHYDWGITEDNYDMRYVRREIVNEREKAEIDEIKARTDIQFVNGGIVSADEVRKKWGYTGPAPEKPDMFGINVRGLNEPDQQQPDKPDISKIDEVKE